jgi:hypothetical protein
MKNGNAVIPIKAKDISKLYVEHDYKKLIWRMSYVATLKKLLL